MFDQVNVPLDRAPLKVNHPPLPAPAILGTEGKVKAIIASMSVVPPEMNPAASIVRSKKSNV